MSFDPNFSDELNQLLVSLLGLKINEIDQQASLFEQGIDSIGIMRTVNLFRKWGMACSFETLRESPTLEQWRQFTPPSSPTPQPATPPPVERPQAMALTPVQEAYWLGRQDNQTLGGVACQIYIELEGREVDASRLEVACERLIARHSMLQTRFSAEGMQYIPDTLPPFRISTSDEGPEIARRLSLRRESLSHRRLDVENSWPFALHLSRLPSGETRLHLNLDLLVADVLSVTIFLRDLAILYRGEAQSLPPLELDFFQYQQRVKMLTRASYSTAQAYWQQRLVQLPGGPQLPLAVVPEKAGTPHFTRRQFLLDTLRLEALRRKAQQQGVTLATLLLTAYCEVLARWSETAHFLVNIPLFNRQEFAPSVPNILADFTSLTLLEVDFTETQDFVNRLKTLQQQLHRDIEHADYSGIEVLRDMMRLDGGHQRAAPVVFACNLGEPFIPPEAEGEFGKMGWMISQTPQVWIDCQSYPTPEGLLLNWDSVDALFPDGMIDAMFNAWHHLLDLLMDDDWQQPALITLPAEVQQVRQQINATTVSRSPILLHQPFFEQATRMPEAPAIITDADTTSYGELALRALNIADELRYLGVAPHQVVAINLPKGVDQIAAVLGVLALGATYLPLAVDHPQARKNAVCNQAGAVCVIGSEEAPWPASLKTLLPNLAAPRPVVREPVHVDPDSLAYIIYTSGSTGEPKGVAMSHRATWNTLDNLNQRFSIGAQDRVLALSGLEFDLSVYDLFGILAVGGAIVLPREDQRRDPDAWIALGERGKVTLWNSVPALLEMLLLTAGDRQLLPALRMAWLSGDRIAPDLAQRLRQSTRSSLPVIAMGGATEAAIWSNAYEIPDNFDISQPVPYGYPLENQRFCVMDAQSRSCPDWVGGELWIGGEGLADGYYNAPTLTEARFITHGGQRWYRTGDRGCYQPNGILQFLGRVDHQVKIDGYRIELAEVESALLRHDDVTGAACLVVEEHGARRLVAVVTGTSSATPTRICQHLENTLPDYMLPKRLLLADALPLSVNGKIDRRAIAEWVTAQPVACAPMADQEESALQRQLRQLWLEVLGNRDLDAQQTFFQLGGNSLQAVRLVNQINQSLGARLTLRDFLRHSTLSALAQAMTEQRHATTETEEGTL